MFHGDPLRLARGNLLEDNDYTRGTQALALADRLRPQFVLIDGQMPEQV